MNTCLQNAENTMTYKDKLES